MFVYKAHASGGAGSSKHSSKALSSSGIPMAASGKPQKVSSAKPKEKQSTTKVTRKAETDFYGSGNFSSLKGYSKSDLSTVNSAPVGSTVMINWGSSKTYARKTSSNSWVSDSGTKYRDRDLASFADVWTKVELNTMVKK